MHAQSRSTKSYIRKLLTRKAKDSMVHIVDMVKSRFSHKMKKASAAGSENSQPPKQSVPMKAPLTRKLTQDEITETELALKRLQAEKERLEELLDTWSERRHVPSLHSSSPSSCNSSCEDVSSNNNVRKELVKIPRYQQKIAFLLHNVFTVEECHDLAKELESNSDDVKTTEFKETSTTHSEVMLDRLWAVIEKEMPKTWMGNKLLGLSSRCILEKQSVGYSHSKPHMDEAYEPIEGQEKSFFSVYLFLNDDYKGGQSSFLKNWQPSTQDVKVQPTQGSIFIHQHNLLHQTMPVVEGSKRIVRLDVLYDTTKRDILSEMYD